MVGQRDITLLITPLAFYDNAHLNRLDFIAIYDKLHRTPLIRFQHWAIEIGGERVYEVTSRDSEDGTPSLRKTSRIHWWDERNQQSSKVQARLIGWTTFPDETLDSRADSIWQAIFEKKYKLMSTNCQVFASVFWAATRVPLHKLEPEREAQLQRLPTAMNPFSFIESKAKQVRRLALAQKNSSWISWMFGGKTPSEDQANADSQAAAHAHDLIPHRPTKSWLDDLNDDAIANTMNHQGDFHDMVRRVNKRQSENDQARDGSSFDPLCCFRGRPEQER